MINIEINTNKSFHLNSVTEIQISEKVGGGTKIIFAVVFGCIVWLFLTLKPLGFCYSRTSYCSGILISLFGPFFFITTFYTLIYTN